MDNSARRRWTILLSLLAVTTVASFFPVEDENQDGVVGLAHASAPAKGPAAPTVVALAPQQLEEEDPFAPRNWQAPPPPELKVIPVPAAAGPVVPLAPVGPPPLPFKFMGRMNDDGKQVLYLSMGDKMLVARNGDTVEGSYKVLGIEPQQIEFEYLPTGDKQTLTITATDN